MDEVVRGRTLRYINVRKAGEPKEAERAQGKNPDADPMNLIRVMPAEGEMHSLVTPIATLRDFLERHFASPWPRVSTRGGLECCKTANGCREVLARR